MTQSSELLDFFEVKEQGFRNEAEGEFLIALFEHSSEWSQLGVTNDCCYINYWNSTLMAAFDICDWNGNVVLRSLKIDFTGTSVLMGETGTNLFDSKFDADSPDVKVYCEVGATPVFTPLLRAGFRKKANFCAKPSLIIILFDGRASTLLLAA